MKRVLFISSLLVAGARLTAATLQPAEADAPDSLRMAELNEVVVKAVKADPNAPYAVSNVDKAQLERHAAGGREIPFLLQMTPGVVAASDNGLGIGTGYLRIRGSADSRINVTLDGMPLNSPEDQCVFWANMNSYAASLGNVQIQRGVGTSTNGDGAFGATVALTSQTPSIVPAATVSASYGSYNTYVLGGSFSTGLIGDHLIFDGRYTETNTDGYVDLTGSRSGSYYGGLTFIDDKVIIRYKNFGNFEKTGQAWNGLDKTLFDAGYSKYNPLNEYFTDADGNYSDDPTPYTKAYPYRTTDNFWYNHNILSAAFQFNDKWSSTFGFRYTHGYGYYKEWRPDNKLKKFGLSDDNLSKTDFIRKKGLTQDWWGSNWNLNYKDGRWDVVGGFSLQNFTCNHFGHLTYAKGLEYLLSDGRYTYYDSDASKFDFSTFVKGSYRINDSWSLFADMQYRHVDYRTDGVNDKFITAGDYANVAEPEEFRQNEFGHYQHILNIDEQFNFANPKAGVSFHRDGHNAYASFAMAHREPSRNNYTDNGAYGAPKHETLLDYEAGYSFTNRYFHAGVNLYYMNYDNQLVQTGEISDIGEALTTNIKNSYRMGIEVTAGWNITSWLSLEGNVALSQNKVKDFDEVVEDWDAETGFRTIHYDNSDLAFSPDLVANGMLHFSYKGIDATWHTNYVGRQYLDNTGCKDRSLDSYTTSNLYINYSLPCKHFAGLKEIIFGLQVTNIFNKKYCPNGGVYSAISESAGYTNDHRYTAIWVYPMAGPASMGNITLKF